MFFPYVYYLKDNKTNWKIKKLTGIKINSYRIVFKQIRKFFVLRFLNNSANVTINIKDNEVI